MVPPRVLVVDDEPSTLTVIRSILEEDGFETKCYQRVDEALGALESEPFELVLTDLYLGDDGTGYVVAQAARGLRPSIPVVLLTGRPTFGNACEAVRTDIQEIIVKPIDSHQLVRTCRRAIETAAMQRRTRKLEARNGVLAQIVPGIVEAKDPTTRGHADRVVSYCDRLAKRLGVSEDDRENLRLAGLLHDIGKVGMPDAILTKPGKLTDAERKEIERHPEIGYDILGKLEDFEDVRSWVYQHHERWDGGGYPNGLSRDEVSLPARILILAEVYDALAEARSYKKAWPNEKIVDFFRHESGRHFDPDLANLVADGLATEGRRFFATSDGMLF